MSSNGDATWSWWPGSANSGLTPVDPRKGLSALTPVDPYASSSASTPVDPFTSSAASTPVDPRPPRALPTPAPAPRGGADPAWVYDNGDALLAQAIRRSQAKVARPPDDLLSRAERASARTGKAVRGSHLWRWAPEFRVRAVAFELLGRSHVVGRALWISTPFVRQGRLRLDALPIFSLDQVPPVDLQDQIDKVVRAAVEREDRMPEVLAQADGFWPFYERLLGFPLASVPTLAELLAVADNWALHVLMALKHACAVRRPVQESSLVLPVIATPGHGSLPSGHATMAALQAELLRTLLYGRSSLRSQQLDRLARRIAFNRVVAGVHFPLDNLVGYRLGTQLAQLFVAWAGARGRAPRALRGADVVQGDPTLREIGPVPGFSAGQRLEEPIENLQALWLQARAEIQDQRG